MEKLLQQRIWRNSSRSINPLFTDPNNPSWGWSWMERWMAAQQWRDATCGLDCGEINKGDARFELSSEANSPTASRSESHRYTFPSLSTPSRPRSVAEAKQLKSSNTRKSSVPDDECSKADARFEIISEANSPTASRSESHRYTFASLSTPSTRRSIAGAAKSKLSSTRKCSVPDDDCKSQASVRSNRSLRHSNGGHGLSLRDDESQTSQSTLPSYMTFTESARAKSRFPSPVQTEKNGVPERTSFSSAKKQLLYPPSPAMSRRHSFRLIAA